MAGPEIESNQIQTGSVDACKVDLPKNYNNIEPMTAQSPAIFYLLFDFLFFFFFLGIVMVRFWQQWTCW